MTACGLARFFMSAVDGKRLSWYEHTTCLHESPNFLLEALVLVWFVIRITADIY